MRLLLRSIAWLCLLAAQTCTWAQPDSFPSKPIRIIIPLGPGSGLDTDIRKLGQFLAEESHQPVIVDNRPGADSAIGIREMLNAPADGYTLVAVTGGMLYMTPFLVKDLAYDPRDLRTLIGLGETDVVLVAGTRSTYTLDQLLAAARKNNGATFFGNYSQTYRGARILLEKLSGAHFTEVPYKGPTQLITDLIGGAFDVAFIDIASALPLIKSGKIRAVATTGAKRNDALPHVPTIAESGYPTFKMMVWGGVGISRKTPKPIVDKVEAMLRAAASRPELMQFYADHQSQPMPMSGDQLGRFIDRETALYRDALK